MQQRLAVFRVRSARAKAAYVDPLSEDLAEEKSAIRESEAMGWDRPGQRPYLDQSTVPFSARLGRGGRDENFHRTVCLENVYINNLYATDHCWSPCWPHIAEIIDREDGMGRRLMVLGSAQVEQYHATIKSDIRDSVTYDVTRLALHVTDMEVTEVIHA